MACVHVVHIIIKFWLKYNNITIVYLTYAIYFSTVFMFITCEFDFQNDFCLAIFYHYFIFKTTYKLTNLNWLTFMCIIFSLDQNTLQSMYIIYGSCTYILKKTFHHSLCHGDLSHKINYPSFFLDHLAVPLSSGF